MKKPTTQTTQTKQRKRDLDAGELSHVRGGVLVNQPDKAKEVNAIYG